MNIFIESEYLPPTILIVVLITIWAISRFCYFHLTECGRIEYEIELRRRMQSYNKQIFELLLYDSAAAVACNDTPYFYRTRQRKLRLLRNYHTKAWIVLFIIRRL